MPEGEQKGWTLQIQLWHVLLLLVVQLLALGAAYGRIEANQEHTDSEVKEIKSRDVVTRSDWEAWRLELIERINRLETKIDNDYLERR